MTELEKKRKAKIPGPDTGIEVKASQCNVCSPNFHCGVSCYIQDGKIIKVEGDKNNCISKGHICTKGAANKEYVYRKDRILTPLRRTGKRGEGKFEAITWDAAYSEITERLIEIREKYGPESVVCFGGYSKWYLPFFHRFAYSFGTPNVIGDGSTCQTSAFLAWRTTTGTLGSPDIEHANTYMGWGLNGYYSVAPSVEPLIRRKEAGMKIVVIDPRRTPATEHLADMHLMLKPGTDGALAMGMAKILIDNDWIDRDYIERYVYGFEDYAAYVKQFDLKRVSAITGVPGREIIKATELYALNGPAAMHESASPLAHHRNGFQNYRAIIALQALTGNYDRLGGTMPSHYAFNNNKSNFSTAEHAFVTETMPKQHRTKIGTDTFPLWHDDLNLEAQGVELPQWIRGEKEYQVKAILGLGMNMRMLPQSDEVAKALQNDLDFFVGGDLFLTDTCKYADIVLPVCSSFERSNFFAGGGHVYYAAPVIEPLGQSKSDLDIIRDLAIRLDLDDPLLKAGYDACLDRILKPTGLSIDEVKAANAPVPVKNLEEFVPEAFSKAGFATPTGKFELRSTVIERYRGEHALDAIPTWSDPCDDQDPEEFPFVLTSGNRIPNALHSRLHDVPSLRAMRQEPIADLAVEDAQRLGLERGDTIEIYNSYGAIQMKVEPNGRLLPGCVNIVHGYREADGNVLIPISACDPYSGFPNFGTTRCNIRLLRKGEKA